MFKTGERELCCICSVPENQSSLRTSSRQPPLPQPLMLRAYECHNYLPGPNILSPNFITREEFNWQCYYAKTKGFFLNLSKPSRQFIHLELALL